MNERTRLLKRIFLHFMLSILIGVVAGLGAYVFRSLIALFHNLMFLGKFSVVYDATIHTPRGLWGHWVILAPVFGAAGVAFLVKNFAPEAKGHGVPEVMDAIYYNKGVIRPIVAVIKAVASALSIGSGGSVGREGPIIQIGASFGSTVGQIIRMPAWQRITLIAAGTGGGIAATFNTPIGGVLFAIEIMLHEISVRTLVPVAISTATATYIGRVFFGPNPSFVIPSLEIPYFHIENPLVLLSYMGLGVISGIVSAIYIRSIYGCEDFFNKIIPRNYYLRHMSGMLVVGVLLYLSLTFLGEYYIEGVGYATIQDVLTGKLSGFYMLLLLLILKLAVTSLTLGSGGSGGIFSPSLYMGATLGGVYGIAVHQVFPWLNISTPAFAVAGMAGMFGGATGAAMAAIVMIFEMTLDYNVIIPMTITVALSYGIRTILCNESIYTLKLARRGHYVPEALQANYQRLNRAKGVMDTNFLSVPASLTVKQCAQMLPEKKPVPWFLVKDPKGVIGIVTKDILAMGMLHSSADTLTIGEIADHSYVIVDEDMRLFDVVARMRAEGASEALVLSGQGGDLSLRVKGIISKDKIAESVTESTELFSG
jgi:chloride channel protein, CIC family